MEIKKIFSENLEKTCQAFKKWHEKKISPVSFLAAFSAIIALRIFIEFFLVLRKSNLTTILIEYLHNWLFFMVTLLLIWFLLSFILKINPKKLTYLVTISFWIIIVPPIADLIATKGDVYWSFYALIDFQDIWSQFSTFFGGLPTGIRYFGTKIGFSLSIFFVGAVIFLKTKSFFKAIFSAFFAYIIIFIMGIFPSFITFLYYFFAGTKKLNEIRDFHAAQFFGGKSRILGLEFDNINYVFAYNLNIIYFVLVVILAVILFYWLNHAKFITFFKNIRLPQLVCHFGLFVIGLGVGYLNYPDNLNLNIFSFFAIFSILVSILLAWKATVVFNDLHDIDIDSISNNERPLQKGVFNPEEYRDFGVMLIAVSFLGGLVIGIKFALILLIYQIIAWFYSASPFRIKKIPLLATLTSSFALILVFFMGFIFFSGENNLLGVSWRVIILLLVVFAFSLPLKDFKDIQGDRKNKIWTIPVMFGEMTAKVIIASGIFISFILSVFLLNESKLFWWALLFGSGSFLLIVSKEIKNTKILWWILGLVFCYGLILVRALFS